MLFHRDIQGSSRANLGSRGYLYWMGTFGQDDGDSDTTAGTVRGDVSPGELIRAVFPGGTITGCPKVRCMEIIAELEDRPRGFYTGAMGYLGRDGSLDLNILIRSIVTQADKLSFAAGSGIVADSDPMRELEEARAKAKGMLLALQ